MQNINDIGEFRYVDHAKGSVLITDTYLANSLSDDVHRLPIFRFKASLNKVKLKTCFPAS
jgi:hypothetical protein